MTTGGGVGVYLADDVRLGIFKVAGVVNLVPEEVGDFQDGEGEEGAGDSQELIFITQFGLGVDLGGVVFAHRLVETGVDLVDADQFAGRVDRGFVGGAGGEVAVGVHLDIVLVLELGDWGDQHRAGIFTLKQGSDGFALEDEVGLQKEETVAADGLAHIVEREHTVRL